LFKKTNTRNGQLMKRKKNIYTNVPWFKMYILLVVYNRRRAFQSKTTEPTPTMKMSLTKITILFSSSIETNHHQTNMGHCRSTFKEPKHIDFKQIILFCLIAKQIRQRHCDMGKRIQFNGPFNIKS
jgi:hypothetical protein